MGPTKEQNAEAALRRQMDAQRVPAPAGINAAKMSGRYTPIRPVSTESPETQPLVRNALFPMTKENSAAVKATTPVAPAAAKIATATSTSNEETNPLRQARLANGSMSEAPPSVYKDLGASNADLIKNAAPGQESRTTIATSGSKAVGFMPDGRDKFETNYAVRGDNGGSGTVKFSGPSQRVGGGTVSVMDQGNGGTAEGNVAAMERQYQALRSQREAMNPGITTGTGAFIPSAAEPVDPFSRPTDGNGDAAGRRSQYEGLIKSANDSGLTAKQRATRLAAAEAMIAPGQEAAKLQNASAMNEADNATRDRATAAQRMNSQLDAESQAAQRSQAQRNADRQFGLQAQGQLFNQLEAARRDERAQTESLRKGFEMGNASSAYAERYAKANSNDKFKVDQAEVANDIRTYFESGLADPTQTSSYIKNGPVNDGEFDKAMALKKQYEKDKVKSFIGFDYLWPDDDRSFGAWLKAKKENPTS